MKIQLKFASLVLPLALIGGAAQADESFCNSYVAGTPLPHFQCVQATVGPGTPMVLSPDQAGSGTRSASSFSAGSGFFASAASASASASPGLLRGKASAEMFGGSGLGTSAGGRAAAWFADGGVVVGAAGVPAGTPVSLRFAIDVAGVFIGGGVFTALSEGWVDLVVRGTGGAFIHTNSTINKLNPTGLVFRDIVSSVGDSFDMLMKLHVSANAVNDGTAANAMSLADISNTSHLYVDVLSGNATFVGSGGHLYATPVPEPSVYAMMLSGLVLTFALARRNPKRLTFSFRS